jgi:hypothetical protein
MEIFMAISLGSIYLLSILVTGWVAKKLGKSYWAWVCLSIPLPIIALSILICLPEEKVQRTVTIRKKRYFNHFITERNPIEIKRVQKEFNEI